MTDLKVQHILTLTQLIAQGARHNFVPITTSYLGKSINKSQQSASKHLRELEKDGFIERIMHGRKFSVKITSKGYSEMVKLSSILKSSLNSFPSFVELKGTLVSGMGEGAYYMSLKGYTKQFKSKINYNSFPSFVELKGTLVSGMGLECDHMPLKENHNQQPVKTDFFGYTGTLNVKL